MGEKDTPNVHCAADFCSCRNKETIKPLRIFGPFHQIESFRSCEQATKTSNCTLTLTHYWVRGSPELIYLQKVVPKLFSISVSWKDESARSVCSLIKIMNNNSLSLHVPTSFIFPLLSVTSLTHSLTMTTYSSAVHVSNAVPFLNYFVNHRSFKSTNYYYKNCVQHVWLATVAYMWNILKSFRR